MDGVRPFTGVDGQRLGSVASPKPVRPVEAERVTTAAGRARPQSGVGRLNPASPVRVDAAGEGVAPSERLLPTPLLRRPEWRETEWAWRRWMSESGLALRQSQEAMSALWAALAEAALAGPIPVRLPVEVVVRCAQPRIEETRNTNSSAADQSQSAELRPTAASPGWETRAVTRDEGGPLEATAPRSGWLLEGRHLHGPQFHQLPEAARRLAEADMWLGSVRGPLGVCSGMGWWIPGPVQSSATHTLEAVPWRARRRTQTAGGRQVHVLQLEVTLPSATVLVRIVACQPSLWVHVVAPDSHWCSRIEASAPVLERGLAACGWRLAQLTAAEQADAPGDGEAEEVWPIDNTRW